ncbi:hypothetical protein P4O66_018163, partial [Electrophorus voltai]
CSTTVLVCFNLGAWKKFVGEKVQGKSCLPLGAAGAMETNFHAPPHTVLSTQAPRLHRSRHSSGQGTAPAPQIGLKSYGLRDGPGAFGSLGSRVTQEPGLCRFFKKPELVLGLVPLEGYAEPFLTPPRSNPKCPAGVAFLLMARELALVRLSDVCDYRVYFPSAIASFVENGRGLKPVWEDVLSDNAGAQRPRPRRPAAVPPRKNLRPVVLPLALEPRRLSGNKHRHIGQCHIHARAELGGAFWLDEETKHHRRGSYTHTNRRPKPAHGTGTSKPAPCSQIPAEFTRTRASMAGGARAEGKTASCRSCRPPRNTGNSKPTAADAGRGARVDHSSSWHMTPTLSQTGTYRSCQRGNGDWRAHKRVWGSLQAPCTSATFHPSLDPPASGALFQLLRCNNQRPLCILQRASEASGSVLPPSALRLQCDKANVSLMFTSRGVRSPVRLVRQSVPVPPVNGARGYWELLLTLTDRFCRCGLWLLVSHPKGYGDKRAECLLFEDEGQPLEASGRPFEA